MTDHRSVLGSRRGLGRAFSTLSIAVGIGIAAGGCSGSQQATTSPVAAASSAIAPSSPLPVSALPSSAAPSASPLPAVSWKPVTAPSASAAASSAASSPAAAGAANAVIHDCKQQSVARPAQFVLACGDGTTSLGSLKWSNWGDPTATATGVYETVVCSPSCAAGAERGFPATVSLTGLSGGAYTEMSINAPKSSPPDLSYSLGATGPRVTQD